VFVEKPLALTVSEGEILIRLAAANRKVLMVRPYLAIPSRGPQTQGTLNHWRLASSSMSIPIGLTSANSGPRKHSLELRAP